MAKSNKDGWIRHGGVKCPVPKGTRVDVRYRSGNVSMNQPALEKGMPSERWAEVWKHEGLSGDIMAYRLHNQATQQEPTTITAEQIRIQYIKNLTSIASLHKKNAALVDDLRKLGFEFHEAPTEPQEDMIDTSDWRVGDLVECANVDDMADMTLGSVYKIVNIDRGIKTFIHIRDDVDAIAIRKVDSRFKFHSRPTK